MGCDTKYMTTTKVEKRPKNIHSGRRLEIVSRMKSADPNSEIGYLIRFAYMAGHAGRSPPF